MNRPAQHKPEAILAAAVAVFGDVGVGASTAKVAKAAGVSNGTLFNYFPSKQDLIDALYVSVKADLADAIGDVSGDEPLRSQIRTIWDRWLIWAKAHPAEHAAMNLLHQSGLASDDARAQATESFRVGARVFADAQAAKLFVELPADYLAELMQHQLDQAAAAMLDEDEQDLAFGVLWNGITTSSSRQHP